MYCFVFDKIVANYLLSIYILILIQNYTVMIIKTMVSIRAIEYFELISFLFLNIFSDYATEYEY